MRSMVRLSPQRSSKALDHLRQVRADLRRRFPALTPRPALSKRDTSIIALGRDREGGVFLLPERARLEHCFVPGTTGGGKSKFLEVCIRQDIAAGRGVLVMDPHGEHPDSLYRSVLSWIKARGDLERRQVHLIDPSNGTHTVGFNPLARDPNTDLSVISGVALEAFSRAWGGEDTTGKPTIERMLGATFSALAELNLSLVEAPMLLDRADAHGLRRHAIATVQDRFTRDVLQHLDELSHDDRRRQDFDIEVIGPINRLARFLRPTATASMVGQTESGLDFCKAFDEGHIILCNLSGSDQIYERDADLLGRLVTRFAFFHAKRRENPRRPFFIYMDECHRYLSGDLENILAESRKYGIGAILATQWLQQLRKESDNMLAAVLNATNVKVVFRAKDPKEAEQLAEMVVPFNLEIPVRSLVKPTVVGYRRIRLANESSSDQRSTTRSRSETQGESDTHSVTIGGSRGVTDTESTSEAESESESVGGGTSRSSSSGSAAGRSENEDLDPNGSVFGPLVTGMSRGRDASASNSESTGSSANYNRGTTATRSSGSARATSDSENWSESASHTTQRSISVGESDTEGVSQSRGSAEALEAELADLPSAVHSRDNVRYMAGQLVRSLPTGRALVNYVGKGGMVCALLKVPLVSDHTVDRAAFDRLRMEVLAGSSSAISAARAAELVAIRERSLLRSCRAFEEPEPASFRTKAPPIAPGHDRSPPAASGRRRTRLSSKPKTVE